MPGMPSTPDPPLQLMIGTWIGIVPCLFLELHNIVFDRPTMIASVGLARSPLLRVSSVIAILTFVAFAVSRARQLVVPSAEELPGGLPSIFRFGGGGASTSTGVGGGSAKVLESREALMDAIDECVGLSPSGACDSLFGLPIGLWDVSSVTDLSWTFAHAEAFDQDLSAWNVSACTSMAYMFYRASSFNQDIGAWDTSAVTSMAFMFYRASSFNQDVSAWDVSACRDMSNMFAYTSAFDQDIGAWDVSSCTDMAFMFSATGSFNQDLSAWNVTAVADRRSRGRFQPALRVWRCSPHSCPRFRGYMFAYTSAFDRDISAWEGWR